MNKNKGFTLIEILIALTVFAIIASITSSTLYYAFTARTRVNEQSDQLSALQLSISLMQQDTRQIIERAIRINDLRLSPAFLGRRNYMEFTRDGDVNPEGIAKRSTLKRIALICKNGSLLRRTWESLDSVNRTIYADKLLIDNLSSCHFAYLNKKAQLFTQWQTFPGDKTHQKKSLPRGIQVNLTLQDHGEINLLFPLAGALYAKI